MKCLTLQSSWEIEDLYVTHTYNLVLLYLLFGFAFVSVFKTRSHYVAYPDLELICILGFEHSNPGITEVNHYS